jgi:4-amino-4-deoxy-L-arabinose transferase-like glycosyltransferase
VALLPRSLGLGRGLTTDEAYHWVGYRSADFLAAISSGRFAETIITGHPGVTTMWLGSLGLLAERGLQAAGLLGAPLAFETHLLLLRLPMALATALAVLLGYALLRRVLGAGVALLAALLWASDPFLVAHSRLLHLDALLSMLMLLALLALLAACFAPHARARPVLPLLLLAGVCSGLALLTKSPSVLLLPSGGVLLLSWWWQARPAASLRMLLLAGLTWGGSALLTALLCWPALWVAPGAAVGSVVAEVLRNGGAPHPGNFLLGTNFISEAPGVLFYPVVLLARLTPWVVLGLLALLWASLRDGASLRPQRGVLLLLLFAALLVPLLLTIPPKKFDRYALPAVPLLHVLAAWGLWWLGARLPQLPRRLSAGALALAASALLLFYHPYYLAYYNPLIGGSPNAPRLVPVGWGEGLDQAAAWLNQQPDLARGPVATWSPPTLAAYLDGETTWQGALQAGEPGYLVVYINQDQTGKESQYFGATHRACEPLHTVRMYGIDYAWIYRVPRYTPAQAGAAQFGAALTLRSSVLVPPAPCSCEPHTLTLVFEPQQAPPQPLFLFLHVVDSQGQPVQQIDLPLDSLIPPAAWGSGDEVPYTIELALPAAAPRGSYRVLAGIYDPASGERLPVQPAGTAASNASSAITTVGPGAVQVVSFEHLPAQRTCE